MLQLSGADSANGALLLGLGGRFGAIAEGLCDHAEVARTCYLSDDDLDVLRRRAEHLRAANRKGSELTWLEIRYPDGGSTRSFLSAPELHRLVAAPAEMRAQALAVLDQHLAEHFGGVEVGELERFDGDFRLVTSPSGLWIDAKRENGTYECFFLTASTLRAVMAVPSRLRYHALTLISHLGSEA
jgi:hypothetical protein